MQVKHKHCIVSCIYNCRMNVLMLVYTLTSVIYGVLMH